MENLNNKYWLLIIVDNGDDRRMFLDKKDFIKSCHLDLDWRLDYLGCKEITKELYFKMKEELK